MTQRTRTGLVMVAMVAVLVVGGLSLAGCHGPDEKPDHSTGGGCPGCAAAKASADGGWCDHCGVGYYAGEKTKCEGCLTAKRTGGSCPACSVASK